MIEVKQIKTALEIKLPIELDAKFADEMMVESKSWLIMSVESFVFDFKNVSKINMQAYRAFIVFAKLVKQGDKKVVSINMQSRLASQLKSDGIIQAFNPFTSEDIAKSAATVKPRETFDVNIINPFIEAVTNTLKVQAQTPCHPGKPHMLKVEDKKYAPGVGIVGIITLATTKLNGTISLVFSEPVFLKIYENMFAEKHDKITGDIQDCAAELLNIIYGTAKTKVNEMPGYDLQPAIPTVLSGEKMNLHQKTKEKVIILPFESSVGPFQMEIALEGK